MQKVIPFPVSYGRSGTTSFERSISQWRGKIVNALTLAFDLLRAMMTAPPEQARIEECRARYARVTGQF